VLLGLLAVTVILRVHGVEGRIAPRAADWVGVGMALGGLGLRLWAIAASLPGTSGRGRDATATALNQTGPYSLLRHPLYAANLLVWTGVGVVSGYWSLALSTMALGVAIYWPILRHEDAFLARRFGDEHRHYLARTPALVPNPLAWRSVDHWLPWRVLLRREYPSPVVASVSLCLERLARTGAISAGWAAATVGILIAGVAIRVIAHRTEWLAAPDGRRPER